MENFIFCAVQNNWWCTREWKQNNVKYVRGTLDDKIYRVYNTPGVAPKSTIQGLQKDMKKGAPEVALKGAFQVTLELFLFT